MEVRPYNHGRDADALWELKEAFERELGGETGDEAKSERYDAKLTDEYRGRYMSWVKRCVEKDQDCIIVAEADGNGSDGTAGSDGSLAGYSFLLPETMAMVWDAAVLNELYVRPRHRGAGVADALMHRSIETAEEQQLPMDRLLLDVDTDNGRARSLYDQYEFSEWGGLLARRL